MARIDLPCRDSVCGDARLCNSPIETIMRFVKAPRQNGPKMAQQSRAASKKAQCQNGPKRPKKAELLSRYVMSHKVFELLELA